MTLLLKSLFWHDIQLSLVIVDAFIFKKAVFYVTLVTFPQN